MRNALAPLAALLSAALAGCGGGGASGSGDFPSFGGAGTIAVNVADAPVDTLSGAVLQFSGIAFKRFGQDETVLNFDPPLRIDLLALQPGQSAVLLAPRTIPAGSYESMRLLVDAGGDALDSFVLLPGGAPRGLLIPAGAESGLRMAGGFTVPAGGIASFTVDMDLRQSIAAPPSTATSSPYQLLPVTRLVNNTAIGSIQGTVSLGTLGDPRCPFPSNPNLDVNLVYVFQGANVAPDDIDRAGVEPLSTTRAAPNGFGAWVYRLDFLPPGNYTVAFTCQGASEDPVRNDNLVFMATRNAVVANQRVTQVDF